MPTDDRDGETQQIGIAEQDTEPDSGKRNPDTLPDGGKRHTGAGPVVGEQWGRFRLIALLGSGGVGVVFAAHDPELDREVAIKVMHDEYLGLAGQERLRREARAMARIAHPNVVPVYEVGVQGGRTFYTMERVNGRSLAEWLATPRPWREIVRVFLDAGRGLAAIHARGMAHRDVKPGNILVGDDGRARIADLGIATTDPSAPPIESLEHSTTIRNAGTPAYMAPEQLEGEIGDAASDQFAFGLTLFEALTGSVPFARDSVALRLESIALGPPALANVPRWLDAIARRALAAEPADRFPSVTAMLDALARPPRRWIVPAVLGGLGISGTAIAAMVLLRSGAPTCSSGTEQLGATWSPPVRARIVTAISALDAPYAGSTALEVARNLDDYAASLISSYDATCNETAGVANTQRLCLEGRRKDLNELVNVLSTPDVAMARDASRAIRALPPVSDCKHPGTHVGSGIHEKLAVALANLAVAKYPAAKAAALDAVAAARASDDRSALAQALLVEGRVELAAGDLSSAVESLTGAAASSDPRERVDAWSFLSSALQELGRLDDARRAIELAEAAVKALADPEREARVLSVKGMLLGRRAQYDESRRYFLRALEIARVIYGADSGQLAPLYHNLTSVARKLKLADALAYAQQELRLAAVLGARHPDVASARLSIGVVFSDLGRYEDAQRELDLALAIYHREADTTRIAEVEQALAQVLYRRHDLPAAITHARAAVAMNERLGTATPNLWAALESLATILLESGATAEAELIVRRVIDDRRRGLGPDHPDVASARMLLARTLAAGKHAEPAITELDDAQRIYELTNDQLGLADALTTRALIERSRRRFKLARDLAIRARQALKDAGVDDAELRARIDELIDRRGR